MSQVPVLPPVTTGVYPTSQVSALIAAMAFAQKPPIAQLRQIATQSLANATFTAITFTASDVDTDYLGQAGHSNSTNTSRYTANFAGWYEISGAVAFANNTANVRISHIRVNGTTISGSRNIIPAASSGANAMIVPVRVTQVYLNVADFVEIYGFQDSGGALNTDISAAEIQSSMSIRWVSN